MFGANVSDPETGRRIGGDTVGAEEKDTKDPPGDIEGQEAHHTPAGVLGPIPGPDQGPDLEGVGPDPEGIVIYFICF